MPDLSRYYNVETLRQAARRILPRAVFDFVDGAAEDGVTASRNQASLRALQLLPRMLDGTRERSQAIELFDGSLAHPLIVAPTGSAGLLWPKGEIAAARAVTASGSVYITSHASTVSLEDIARAASGRLWFQGFVFRDRSLTDRMMERASAAGYEAFVLTVDTQVPSKRELDLKNGFTVPPRWNPRTVWDFASHPRWALRLAGGGPVRAANYQEAGFASLLAAGQRIPTLLDPATRWDDVRRIRDRWKGKLVVKGLLHPAEAVRAVEEGVDAIVVSNHGGRQLDGVPASIDMLAPVARAVAGRIPVLIDGGFRRGTDVLKARALGATAVLLGRPHLWGLAVAGEAGVSRVLEILRREMELAMAMGGFDGVGAMGPQHLWNA